MIKIKLEKKGALCWVGDDEADAFRIEGRADTVEAVARILRTASHNEHEISQRGVNREAFESDLTKSEIAAIAAAKADAESKAKLATEASKVASDRATLEAEHARLGALLGKK